MKSVKNRSVFVPKFVAPLLIVRVLNLRSGTSAARERYAFVRRGMLRLVRFVSHCPALPASPAPAMTASEAIVRAERYLRAPPVAKQPPIGPPPKRAPHAPPLPQQQKQQ